MFLEQLLHYIKMKWNKFLNLEINMYGLASGRPPRSHVYHRTYMYVYHVCTYIYLISIPIHIQTLYLHCKIYMNWYKKKFQLKCVLGNIWLTFPLIIHFTRQRILTNLHKILSLLSEHFSILFVVLARVRFWGAIKKITFFSEKCNL